METLKKYLPEKSVKYIFEIIKNNNIHFKIAKQRRSKHGDFKSPNKISINGSLNKYAFLITTIHEIAHFYAFKRHGNNILPHGNEWKNYFIKLMNVLPLVEIFPNDIMKCLSNYLRNPKASTNSDEKLYLSLKEYDNNSSENNTLENIPDGETFTYKNKEFIRIEKRQKLILCKNIQTSRQYLFKSFVEIS